MKKNYYKCLLISQDAKEEDIKKAFRKLSKQYHPDKNNGSKESTEKFKLINEANQILIDPFKRKDYDQNLADEIKRDQAIRENRQNKLRMQKYEWLKPLTEMAAVLIIILIIAGIFKSISNNIKS